MAEDIIGDITDEIEALFPHKPGGLVDRHQQEVARREEARRERENADEPVEEHSYKSVKVTTLSPEVIATNVVVIGAGQVAQVLPNSPYRYRAVIIVNSFTGVILAKDSSQALGGTGFTLPAATMMPVYTRAQLYAFNPGGAAVIVNVFAELYGPEGH